jgi:hypothetical protein
MANSTRRIAKELEIEQDIAETCEEIWMTNIIYI